MTHNRSMQPDRPNNRDHNTQCDRPELSIIIVSWNTREILRTCLQTVHDNSTNLNIEVFVVDNNSSDHSADMVARDFPSCTLIRNETNRGFGPANNQALKLSRAPFVLLLNADTEVLPNTLNNALQWMRNHPAVAVMGCKVRNPDRSLQPTCFRNPDLRSLALNTTGLHRLPWPRCLGRHDMRHWNRNDTRHVDVVTGCFMLVRQTAIDQVGQFDEQFFFYAEEADWCLRFRNAGWHVCFAPVGEIIHLGGASTLQIGERRALLLGSALIRLIRKHRGMPAAIIAWLLVLGFIASRAVAWTTYAFFKRTPSAKQRARDYRMALRKFTQLWPAPAPPQESHAPPQNAASRPAATLFTEPAFIASENSNLDTSCMHESLRATHGHADSDT